MACVSVSVISEICCSMVSEVTSECHTQDQGEGPVGVYSGVFDGRNGLRGSFCSSQTCVHSL